jgi:hypothetical protein
MSKVAHSESVELYVAEAIRKGVDLTGLGQLVILFTTKKFLGGVNTRIHQWKS